MVIVKFTELNSAPFVLLYYGQWAPVATDVKILSGTDDSSELQESVGVPRLLTFNFIAYRITLRTG